MKAILRNVVLGATAAVTAMTMSTAPANAAGAVTFTGGATINCFGCGPSSGKAFLCINGQIGSHTYVHVDVPCTASNANADASFSLNEPAATCPATGSANGTVKTRDGNHTITFAWTRVAGSAVITTAGDIAGGGSAAFAPDSPLPCNGTNVTATFAGSVAGA